MVNHSSRSRKLQTIYLWRAWQSEPGQEGASYRATLDAAPPNAPEPVQAMPGLVYAESMHGDWHLLGTCTGFLVEDATGESAVENRDGDQWSVESIVRGGRFREPRG